MDILKKIFPFSFLEKKDVAALVITIVIHVLAGIVIGIVMWLLPYIPFVSTLISLTGTLINLYITGGIVFSILNYCKVIK